MGTAAVIFYLPRLLDFTEDKFFAAQDLSFLRVLQVIGSMITKEIYERIENKFKATHGTTPMILSAYGSTELGFMAVRPGLFDSKEDRINTLGQCSHTAQMRLRNLETGEEITEADVQGEVEILSPFRMLGYKTKEQGTEWFQMGDLGKYDKKGYLILGGRIKEQIVLRNTKKTNATAIDMQVQTAANIDEVATVSIRNENGYDDVHIFIRCAESEDAKITEFCEKTMKQTLVDSPILHIQRVEIPRLPTGKYDKKELNRIISEN